MASCKPFPPKKKKRKKEKILAQTFLQKKWSGGTKKKKKQQQQHKIKPNMGHSQLCGTSVQQKQGKGLFQFFTVNNCTDS